MPELLDAGRLLSGHGVLLSLFGRCRSVSGVLSAGIDAMAVIFGGRDALQADLCDSRGLPLNLFVTAGQASDYIRARALLSRLPDVDWLLGDRGYDADWFREALKDKGIRACIPGRKQRKKPV